MPHTILDSQNAVESVCAQIDALPQDVEGSANPANALRRAEEIFNAEGAAGSQRNIIITATDRTPSAFQYAPRHLPLQIAYRLRKAGVRICAAALGDGCTDPDVVDYLVEMANTDASGASGPKYPNQPVGTYQCVTQESHFAALALACNCAIANAGSADCNDNHIPNVCVPDCNSNGIPDDCDISSETSADCNNDGIPDECETDCNNNGIPDDCDIAGGTSHDWDMNGIPDECEAYSSSIIYVDGSPNVPGPRDGTAWDKAYATVQVALAEAATNCQKKKIHVAGGLYLPTPVAASDPRIADPEYFDDFYDENDPCTASFWPVCGVAIIGGFGGFDAGANADTRDLDQYETVLSGAIGIPEDSNDNSYHVVLARKVAEATVLNGLTIAGGNAGDYYHLVCGGGILCLEANPTVVNCTIRDNSAIGEGGGAAIFSYNYEVQPLPLASPTFADCVFLDNTSQDGSGGGLNDQGGGAEIVRCRFEGNTAWGYGGGISTVANTYLTDCELVRNSAYTGGGAFFVGDNDVFPNTSVLVTKSAFMENCADGTTWPLLGTGGGAAVMNGSVIDCLFHANTATTCGGLECGPGVSGENSDSARTTTLSRCVFTDNESLSVCGGGLCSGVNTVITQCSFISNIAHTSGGGIHNWGARSVANCVFRENVAFTGGGLFNTGETSVTNCTFSANSADATYGMGGGMDNAVIDGLTVTNCIFWGNVAGEDPAIHNSQYATATVTYSCIQDEQPGDAQIPLGGAANFNIDDDPLLDVDLRLTAGSPCVDAGNSPFALNLGVVDLDGNPRIQGAAVDMGAYETQGSAFFCNTPPQDVDGDGDVDLTDFGVFSACFGGPGQPYADPRPECVCLDADADGDVDLADFGAFSACFNGPGRPPACL